MLYLRLSNNIDDYVSIHIMKIQTTIIIRFIIFFLLITQITNVFASDSQNQSIKGKIVDRENIGISYASIALQTKKNDVIKVVTLAACEEGGIFTIDASIPEGKYTLQVSCVGYTSQGYEVSINEATTDLGTFVIDEGVELDELVVSSQRKYVTTKVDRLIYNVEDDPDAATSSTLQILDKVPFIEVNKLNNRIKVMGEEHRFKILINGKESLLLSETNQQVAEILKAGNLKEIELITSPDGRYYTQTAVINIITKSSLADGLAGSVSANASDRISAGSGFNLTSKIGKIIYNVSYGYGYFDDYGSKSNTYLENYKNDTYHFSNTYYRNSPSSINQHLGEINLSYDFNKNDLLSIKAKTQLESNRASSFSHNTYQNEQNITTREFQNLTKTRGSNKDFNGSINYQRSFNDKPGRLLTATYSINNSDDESKYDEQVDAILGYNNSSFLKENNLKNIEHIAAIDFYTPISSKQSFYITSKYVDRDYSSDSWLTDMNIIPNLTTRPDGLKYRQQIASLEGNYSLKWEKVMLTAQAGYDYEWNDIKFINTGTSLNRNEATPIISLRSTYRPNSKNFIILGLARNVFRPDISYLNPYEDTSVAGQIRKGNPDIESEKTYFANIIYRYFIEKRLALNFVSFIRYSDNAIYSYSYIDNQSGNVITTYGNIGKRLDKSISLRLDYNTSRISTQLGGALKHQEYEYQGNKNSFWTPTLSLFGNLELWKGGYVGTYIDFSTVKLFQESSIQTSKQHMQMSTSFSMGQQFGAWRISVHATEPFTTYKNVKLEEMSSDFYRYNQKKTLGRSVFINVTYNFGSFKDSVKSAQRAVKSSDRSRE